MWTRNTVCAHEHYANNLWHKLLQLPYLCWIHCCYDFRAEDWVKSFKNCLFPVWLLHSVKGISNHLCWRDAEPLVSGRDIQAPEIEALRAAFCFVNDLILLSILLSLFFKISMGIPIMWSWFYLLWFVLKFSKILTVNTIMLNTG